MSRSSRRTTSRSSAARPKLGPTNLYPHGVANETDRGELTVAIGYNAAKDIVEIHFGTELSWLGFDPERARAFGEMIIKAADKAKAQRPN